MNEKDETTEKPKLDSSIALFKKIKFVVLAVISTAVLCVALLSGDGLNIFSTLYEKITGQKHETFSPVENSLNESYLVLKAKLSRDTNTEIENATITIYKESESLHKYRVVVDKDISIYKVSKDKNGIWTIIRNDSSALRIR